jgi:hypothetical protein
MRFTNASGVWKVANSTPRRTARGKGGAATTDETARSAASKSPERQLEQHGPDSIAPGVPRAAAVETARSLLRGRSIADLFGAARPTNRKAAVMPTAGDLTQP